MYYSCQEVCFFWVSFFDIFYLKCSDLSLAFYYRLNCWEYLTFWYRGKGTSDSDIPARVGDARTDHRSGCADDVGTSEANRVFRSVAFK